MLSPVTLRWKKVVCWASNVGQFLQAFIRQPKCRLKMIIQTERFRESSCKHCVTDVLVKEGQAVFLACHVRSLRGKYYYLAC